MPGRKLVVEVDGGQHADNRDDVVRDRYLENEGFGCCDSGTTMF